MAYTRTYTIDAGPSGDTTKAAVATKLDGDLTTIFSSLTSHEAMTTNAHGVGAGTIASTNTTQTLTFKTISGATITGASTLNGLTHTAATTGFTIAGGTASKTLTVDETVAMSSKAPKDSPAFTTLVTAPKIATTSGALNLATSGVAATAFTVSGNGLYLVYGYYDGYAIYTANARVMANGAQARIISEDGPNLTITLSGLNVQFTQNSGGELIVAWVYQKIGA
jgi:hypothetical protein